MALDDRFPVEVAVWFPGCEIGEKIKKFPLAYREAEQAVLDLKSFEEGPQAIYDVFDFMGREKRWILLIMNLIKFSRQLLQTLS